MKKLKYLLSTALVCVVSLSMISCGTSNTASTKKDVSLTISAAASLKEAMTDIEPLFKEKYPNISLTFNYGASGSLQQQIEQGAPSDVFISAGKSQMTALSDKGLLTDGTNKDLVQNALVLVGPKNTTVTSLDDLTTDKVKKIAVGEPSSVPAGKYADESLTKLNIKDKVSSKLVQAKDVKEVLAWSTTGNADVGFVYLSDAKSSPDAKVIATVPENLHSKITYPAAVIKASANQDEAKEFEDFLYTDDAKAVFEKYGYTIAQ